MASGHVHSSADRTARAVARVRDASRGLLGDCDPRWLVPIAAFAALLLRWVLQA